MHQLAHVQMVSTIKFKITVTHTIKIKVDDKKGTRLECLRHVTRLDQIRIAKKISESASEGRRKF
jgi:hypothetical protein